VRPHHALPIGLLTALLASCGEGATGTQPTTQTLPSITTSPSNSTAAVVLQVFDGDTLLALVDGAEEEVRLLGINAPERDECHSGPASAALAELTASRAVSVDAAGGRDGYGRLLAYVYADGTLINLALLADGAAIAVHTDHQLLEQFLDAEEAAFTAELGLWAPEACGPAITTGVVIVSVAADPAGPDGDALHEEYVTLTNTGAAEADLSGWKLRDESSQHRYNFHLGTLIAPGAQVRVHTGCGSDDAGDLYWCADGPVWNNGGDSVLLLDPSGNVAGRLRYRG